MAMAMPQLFSFVVFVAALVMIHAAGASATTFNFKNNCAYTVWPGTLANSGRPPLPQNGFQLDSGASLSVDAPPEWGGRMWARTRCSADASGRFSCLTGDCGSGQVACNGAGGAVPTTLVEFTLQGDGGKDFYDVSNVDGFNVQVSVVPVGGSADCSSTECSVDINALCPAELRVTDAYGSVAACMSACSAFADALYCCSGAYGTPTTCGPTRYSMIFKNACPQAYSYAYDDTSSTFTCVGADYHITFCP